MLSMFARCEALFAHARCIASAIAASDCPVSWIWITFSPKAVRPLTFSESRLELGEWASVPLDAMVRDQFSAKVVKSDGVERINRDEAER